MSVMNVGIVGTGLQARRRLASIDRHAASSVAAIAGLETAEAEELARVVDGWATTDWEQLVADDKLDIVVICTPPDIHHEIARASLEAGKHVLCEKPLTRNSRDAQALVDVAREHGRVLKCGFNHRHHPAMQEAYRVITAGGIGDPITARAVYGICGRPGCETEWRSDPTRAAGGQLMEQGIHAIDLFRWFIGEFDAVSADVATHVFPIQPLEDTASALLHRKDGVTATVHSSITQWRNRFRFELYGSEGYIEIAGLGGSYDLQRLHIGARDPNAPFSERVIDYRGGDKSWAAEWSHFMGAIVDGSPMIGTGADGVAASRIVEAAYRSARERRRVDIEEESS